MPPFSAAWRHSTDRQRRARALSTPTVPPPTDFFRRRAKAPRLLRLERSGSGQRRWAKRASSAASISLSASSSTATRSSRASASNAPSVRSRHPRSEKLPTPSRSWVPVRRAAAVGWES
eukprot:scaffold304934_cov27-Tisochrysis_lutea.AAC.1